MYRKSRFALLSLAVAVVVAAVFAHPAQAATIASSANLPLSGTYYDSVAGENVVVTGTVHITSIVTISPSDPIYIVYSDVQGTGVGQTTGNSSFITLESYNWFTYPEPIPTQRIVLTGEAKPTPPIIVGSVYNAHTLFIPVTLSFASDGTLQSESSTATVYPFDTIVVVPCID